MGSITVSPPLPVGLMGLNVAVVAFGRQLHGAGECSDLKGFDKVNKRP